MALSKKPVNGMKDILPEEMQTREHVPIHAVGNMLLLRRTDRDSTCLYMRMREEHIYLTLRIYA